MAKKNRTPFEMLYVALGTLMLLGFVGLVGVFFVLPQALNPTLSYEHDFILTVNESSFPDREFRDYVSEYVDRDQDGFLSIAEREQVKSFGDYDSESFEIIDEGLSHRDIYSLDGIEFFPHLETLVAQSNQISALDISQNSKLIKVDLRQNPQFTVKYADANTTVQILSHSGYVELGGR